MSVSEILPSVRLSPKVMKRVRESRGTALTVTAKPHVADRPPPSTAVQVTGDEPDGNNVPADGVHVIVTGAAPPVAVGIG